MLYVLVAPTVREFSPKAITVDEGDRVEFVCKATGLPTPIIKVTKVRPAPGMVYPTDQILLTSSTKIA